MEKPVLPAFLSVQGVSLSDDEKRLFEKYNPLGVCLFSYKCENVKSRVQLRALCRQIKEVIGRDDVLIAVDQEGGRVRRLCEPEFSPLAGQSSLKTLTQAKNHAYLAASDLKDVGINVNYAPVLDVEYSYTSNALRGRCFSADNKKVAKLARAMNDTYIKYGICPCVKHLPGHGRAENDPHLELPVVKASIKELQSDFYPFKMLSDAPMGMVAHLVLSAIDDKNPATESKTVINEIIRKEIGFKGLLVSDAIMMNALKGSISERAKRVFEAGCEVICLGNSDFKENQELCDTGLVMSDSALEKLKKIVEICKIEPKFENYANVQKKYCEMQKNIISYEHKYDATEVLNRLNNKQEV